jgi:hypothetical protein
MGPNLAFVRVVASHISHEDVEVARVLRRARTIALIGVSARPDRHSRTVMAYLRRAGYEVFPVRSDGQDVEGLKTFLRLEDVPGRVDVAVIYRRADAAPAHLEEAVRKGVEAVWLPPGVWTQAIERVPHDGTTVVRDRCIEDDHLLMREIEALPTKGKNHAA